LKGKNLKREKKKNEKNNVEKTYSVKERASAAHCGSTPARLRVPACVDINVDKIEVRQRSTLRQNFYKTVCPSIADTTTAEIEVSQ
jgi:hypothetical protein